MRRTIFTLFAFWMTSFALFAAESNFKALLVSIEKYDIAPLDFATNDIEKFQVILAARYDCVPQVCVDTEAGINDTGEDAAKESVMRKIENWCKGLTADDTAILYLSGHGVKDDSGNFYLAMINFDRKNFETAAIPLKWIRDQFGQCKGKSKMLFIDTCFAGTAKNFDFEQINSGDMSGTFAGLKDIVTIASCRSDEKSWLWSDAKHSLFTYWLIEAFKGHADLDGDRTLTCEEIVQYLQNNVPLVAKIALDQNQHPVVHNESAGAGFRLPLHAVTLARLIDDIADQIDLWVRLEKVSQIGVPVFTSGSNKTFDPQYGTLPSWASAQLRDALAKKSRANNSGYKVISENALRELLASKSITSEDLGTEKTKNINVGGSEIPLLVDGQMTLVGKTGVSLYTKLLDTQDKSDMAQTGGVAVLSVTEIGMTDTSGKFAISSNTNTLPQRHAYVPEEGIGLTNAPQIQNLNQFHNEQNKPHPMADTSLPFKVWFEVRPINSNRPNAPYKERKVQIEGNHCYLPLEKGEEYIIKIENKTNDLIFSRILVDGLNTLSQKETLQTRGAYIVEANSESEVIAPRASLSDAKAWVLNQRGPFGIAGFYNAKEQTVGRFQIVDADQSVAVHRNYTEQLGIITIGFFRGEPVTSTRGATGTGMGDAEQVNLKYYEGDKVPGEMMAVYNIRYMTQKALSETLKK